MKKTLFIVYLFLFAVASFGLVTASAAKPSPATSVPTISERAIIGTDYDLIAQKIFDKFLAKYPNVLQQVKCENIDTYVNKMLQKMKIKFRKPDVNKENIVKHKFESLLRDYLDNSMECDDFIDVDRDDNGEIVHEVVKCVFGSNQSASLDRTIQSCYSSDGRWSCKGQNSCSIEVNGYLGEHISWKSTCGGYASTTIDGRDKYAWFSCAGEAPVPAPNPQPSPCVSADKNLDCMIQGSGAIKTMQKQDTKLKVTPKKK